MNSSNLQLLIVQEVQEIASARNFQIWLRGWAIDFLLGKITREHSDVDLDTWIQELVMAGFKKLPVSEFQTDFLKNGVDVSIVFASLSDNGDVFANSFPD